MKRRTLILLLVPSLLIMAGLQMTAQDPGHVKPLTLQECYALANENYPMVKQYELIERSRDYSIENAQKAYLPQIGLYGQASYQSDVTKIPINIPGVDIPQLTKDQYKLYGDITYSLTGLVTTKNTKDLVKAQADIDVKMVEVELYNLRERINALFFGILLVDAQIEQNELVQCDIRNGIDKVEVAIANGTALKSTADNLKAELLKARQHTTELKATRRGYAEMLSLFIGETVDEKSVLIKPLPVTVSQTISRPEMELYQLQSDALDLQNRQVVNQNLPNISLFFQGGYGRPALNILSDKFDPYYVAGVRLSWNISGFYTYRNKKRQIADSQSGTRVRQETFIFNTNLTLSRQNAEIAKALELTVDDDSIIALRESVKKTVQTQLDHGTATTNDYIIAVNSEDQARKNRILHEIQWLMAQYNAQTTTGGAE